MPSFSYEATFQHGGDDTPYRLLTTDFVSTIEFSGRTFLKVDPRALRLLAKQAFADVSFYLRPGHLRQLREELGDPEASDNDRLGLAAHLQNAVVAAAGPLPSCQDPGTAIVLGKKGQYVLTDGDDAEAISGG